MENLALSEPVIEIEDFEFGQQVLNFILQDKQLARAMRKGTADELNKSGFIDDVGWIGNTPALIRCYVLIPIPAQMIRFDRACSAEMQEASAKPGHIMGDQTLKLRGNQKCSQIQ